MSNTTLTADVIAKEALAILENDLGVLGTFHRAMEDEYDSTVNGYKKGATISIRRPADFVVRSGAVMNTQDVIEGKVSFTVDQQKGIDFQFTSTDLTLKISDLSERVIKPAMSSLINEVTYDCMETFLPYVYNYVGVPNAAVDSFDDFYRAQERLNEMAVPTDSRYAVLNPADHARMIGNLTGLYISSDAQKAYRQGNLGNVGGADTMMTQVMPAQTYGTADNTTPLVRGASQNVTYETAKDTWTQTFSTDGWDSSSTLKAGQVFTIANVFMVNPKTKRSTGILQQFTITTDATANATTSNETSLTISPPIITSGPHQTVNAAPADNAAITIIGPASGTLTSYRQNVTYHKNAFALAMVPMEMPQGAYNGARKSYKGLSVRVIPVFDGINDVSKWRLDVLYGRKTIDPRLAVRFSGQS